MNAYEFIIKMRDYASSGIQQIAKSVGILDNNITGISNKTPIATSGLTKLAGVATGLFLSWQAFDAVKTLFNKGVELEQTRIKFEVLLGSVEKGTAMLKELNNYANATPYSNQGIIKGAETMLGFGIAHEKIMGNMKMLGDVAMGNEEKLSGLSLVYSQVMATGRLMGQDLLQLINQGFNPLQVISDNTGISMAELKNKMEDGAISATMIEKAFRLATSEGGRYYGMADNMSNSAGGKWSTFMGSFVDLLSRVGLKLAEWVTPLIDIGIIAVNNLVSFGKAILSIFNYITQTKPLLFFLSGIALALGVNFLIANASALAWAVTLGILEGVIWLVNAATAAWNFILSLNPIALVIIAVAGLIAIVMVLWNKFDGFRGVVMGVWQVIKGLGEMIKNYVINRFKELLSGITGIGSALLAFFKGDFSGALDIGRDAMRDLLGVDSKKQAIQDGYNAFKGFSEGYEKGVKNYAPVGANSKTSTEQTQKKQAQSSIFDELFKNDKDGNTSKIGNKSLTSKGDPIVSGGSKMTSITINIQKLQDDTKIFVESTEKGLEKLGEKIQEVLLRSINSVNQMQTV